MITTNIAWTRSTFNPWIGCTKVSPGCDGCYAENSHPTRVMGVRWGAGEKRHVTSKSTWNAPKTWNKLAALEKQTGVIIDQHSGKWSRPGYWPVFCASLADVFDNEVPHAVRANLWRLIDETPNLEWQLVTKRIGNVERMLPEPLDKPLPKNFRLIISVVNQQEADRDIPKLLEINCKNGVSYEPALGPVDFRRWLEDMMLGWIIVGGESTQGSHLARPFDVNWARSTVAQCKEVGVPVFVKQIGSMPKNWCASALEIDGDEPGMADLARGDYCDNFEAYEQAIECARCFYLKHRSGSDPAEWPADLRVQEFPE